ncbi:MAG: Rne/Rng family ribonuclease [Candidatus Electronema sp. V4]|uniref:Rne/Rng family ribonuclease n=1 Tax=Candidatus Electronema sp. V4 TaxID=3454756 RepID=UPI00405549DB
MTDEAEKPAEEQQEKKARKASVKKDAPEAAAEDVTLPAPKKRAPRKKKSEETAAEPVAAPAAGEETALADSAPEKKAPKKRAPRKKKNVEPATAEPAAEIVQPEAPAEAVVPSDAVQEKKVPKKRAPRKKKSEEQPVTAEAATPVAEEAAPPVPAEEQPAAAEESAGSAAESAADAPPVKKKRSRRRGKKKAEPQTDQGGAAAITEAAPAPPPAEEKGQRKKKRPERQPQRSRTEDDDEDDLIRDEEPQERSGKKVCAKLLINAEEPEECRIAIVEDGRLETFHVSTTVSERTKNNIYKGRIVSIEPNLQAAFVEIGTGRNGFLPFCDIHPEYYKEDISEQTRTLIRQQQWRKLKIEDVVNKGQEVLVQVVKEITGNKGANMTTYLSLPGRCLVLMPGSDSTGISRKISGEERRSELRQMIGNLSLPEGIGYIIRTASAEITPVALEEDLGQLLTLWEEIKRRGQTMPSPAMVYEDQDTIVRFLRDHFTPEIHEIIADTQDACDQATRFVAGLPEQQRKIQVKLHRGVKPVFNQHSIEEQIESIYQPQVQLPSGGSIVINPTEALVAIDVNSGRTSQRGDFDQSIFLANMEAADELARQLRLRDLGGLIVVDFIDMRNMSHIKEVERQVKNAMRRDKAKVDISRISRFGLMQISRQKMGAPIEKGSYHVCEYCGGRGVLRSVETLALHYLRRIQTGVSRRRVRRVEVHLPLEVGQYLLNKKREDIAELEAKHQAAIEIRLCPEMKPNDQKIDFLL